MIYHVDIGSIIKNLDTNFKLIFLITFLDQLSTNNKNLNKYLANYYIIIHTSLLSYYNQKKL